MILGTRNTRDKRLPLRATNTRLRPFWFSLLFYFSPPIPCKVDYTGRQLKLINETSKFHKFEGKKINLYSWKQQGKELKTKCIREKLKYLFKLWLFVFPPLKCLFLSVNLEITAYLNEDFYFLTENFCQVNNFDI